MTQYDLFGDPIPKIIPKEVKKEPEKVKPIIKPIEKPQEAPRQEKKNSTAFDIDDALRHLREKEYCFWDMRVWQGRTHTIAMKFLKNFEEKLKVDKNYLPTFTNCGNSILLIGKLISNKVPLETIADNLMMNNHITFLYRITECFHHSDRCPYWKHYKNFIDCNCERRCDKKEIIGDEHLNQ